MKKTFGGRLNNGDQDDRQDDPVCTAHESPSRAAEKLHIQLTTGELGIRLDVLFASLSRHFRGKSGGRRLLVPANFFEVIANILLVERILRFARLVGSGRPEARGIWGK